MVRLSAKSDEEIVKSIIKEIRDAGDKRLSYEEIGRVHFDKDTEDARYYDLQPDSRPIITQIRSCMKRIALTSRANRSGQYSMSPDTNSRVQSSPPTHLCSNTRRTSSH